MVSEGLVGSFAFHLGIVLLGFKPATTPSTYRELEFACEYIKDMGLDIKTVNLDYVDTEDVPEYAEKPGEAFFVGREEDLSFLERLFQRQRSV